MEGSGKSGLLCLARCWSSRGRLGLAGSALLFLSSADSGVAPSIPRRFLDKMRAESDDKIVLISNYTETLDVIERLLNAKKYATSACSHHRLSSADRRPIISLGTATFAWRAVLP